MPRTTRENSNESRTRSIGSKRSSGQVSPSDGPRKRRRNIVDSEPQHQISVDNSFAALSYRSDSSRISDGDLSPSDLPDSNPLFTQSSTATMSNPNFGRNRLATGFVRPQTQRQDSQSSGEIFESASEKQAMGQTLASPIEISDDEMEESEGGMVINVDQFGVPAQMLPSDDSMSEESGEIASAPKNPVVSDLGTSDLFVVDPTPSAPTKRLIDLSASELDDQLRYAMFHLNRDQIDLNRPVLCLTCSSEGHLHHDCQRKNKDIFPLAKADPKAQVKLWISCCICASKSHLVGDCPELRDGLATSKWSLKTLRPEQIINMNATPGTRKWEKEAENNGMRPAGLQIRGRAGLHHAGQGQRESSNDDNDEQFLRKPLPPRQERGRNTAPHPQRYDRYDPPSDNKQYRGGGPWYATDSFGNRRRSRSPDDRYDAYRPRDDYHRRMSPQRDSWRPSHPNERRDGPRGRPRSPPPSGNAPMSKSRGGTSASGPGSNIQFALPTRKGSNTWSQSGHSGTSTPTTNGKPPGAGQSKKSRNKNRKK